MKEIIVFYGYKGSGKDTCYELYKEISDQKVIKLSFAGKLREVVWDLFKNRIGDERLLNGSITEKETEIEGWFMPQDIKDSCGFTETFWTGRRLLQWFGTEVCRNVDNNVWIDAFKEQMETTDADVICITDCRFKNEYDLIQNLDRTKYEVAFVHVERSTDDNEFSSHASERDLKSFECDVRLKNDKSLDVLRKRLIDLEI